MSNLTASLVAVFGTLAGSTLTFLFQRHSARQTEQFARNQQLWSERVAAHSAFAATLTDFRRSQNDRWHLEQADPSGTKFITAREESYKFRANTTAAMCRVRLICGSLTLSELAQRAVDAATEIHEAVDENDRASRSAKARRAVDQFLDEASLQIQSLPPTSAGSTI
jgi:hypothetical protein